MSRNPDEASEVPTPTGRVIVKTTEEEVFIRIERRAGNGYPLYETLRLTWFEADALHAAIMDEIG